MSDNENGNEKREEKEEKFCDILIHESLYPDSKRKCRSYVTEDSSS